MYNVANKSDNVLLTFPNKMFVKLVGGDGGGDYCQFNFVFITKMET